jgi:hypothetical protein
VDADDPPDPANDFHAVNGDPNPCCRFLLDARSVAGSPPQARARVQARLRNSVVETLGTTTFAWPLPAGFAPGSVVELQRVQFSARIGPDHSWLGDGVLAGVFSIPTLASIAQPCVPDGLSSCPPPGPNDPTLADLAAGIGQPDVDLDGDGTLDTLRLDVNNLRIGGCLHGQSEVEPIESDMPWTCALRPQIADGYTIALEPGAVPATVAGIAP